MIVIITFRPPPPTPASTLPRIIIHCSSANPQIRLPRAKKQLLTTKPDDREKMSVNLPISGCVIACPMRKAVASQARRESELKLVAIGAARVAMIVLSERPTLGLVSCTDG